MCLSPISIGPGGLIGSGNSIGIIDESDSSQLGEKIEKNRVIVENKNFESDQASIFQTNSASESVNIEDSNEYRKFGEICFDIQASYTFLIKGNPKNLEIKLDSEFQKILNGQNPSMVHIFSESRLEKIKRFGEKLKDKKLPIVFDNEIIKSEDIKYFHEGIEIKPREIFHRCIKELQTGFYLDKLKDDAIHKYHLQHSQILKLYTEELEILVFFSRYLIISNNSKLLKAIEYGITWIEKSQNIEDITLENQKYLKSFLENFREAEIDEYNDGMLLDIIFLLHSFLNKAIDDIDDSEANNPHKESSEF